MLFILLYLASAAAKCLPQISQIYTELLVGDILPQNTQISQNFLLRMFSHRFHSKFAEECDAVA